MTRAWLWAAALIGATAAPQAQPSPQTGTSRQPFVYRTGTELVAIDTAVVNERGEPVADLAPGDFTLSIDGTPRKVVTAQFIRQDPPGPAPTMAGRKLPYSTNEASVGGRLVLVVFDLEGIAAGSGRAAANAASKFVDQLSAADRVGLLAYPSGVNAEFTTDRAAVREALTHIMGRAAHQSDGIYNIGTSEAFEIDRGSPFMIDQAVRRECSNENTPEGLELCRGGVTNQASQTAASYRQHAETALQVLRSLFSQLKKIDAPKTVVWISEGLPLDDSRSAVGGLAADAAAARTTVYTLHLDQMNSVDASRSRPSPTAMQDRMAAQEGLATIAGVTRGRMFSSIGSGEDVFARIAREMTAYYLLTAEPVDADRDGKAHKIKVAVARPGVTVRARREFTLRADAAPMVPEQRLSKALQSPLPATELLLRVATFNMRTAGAPTVKVIVTAEFGQAAATEQASLGYVVMTDAGKVVTSGAHQSQAPLLHPGKPGPLQTTTAVEVPPGKYTLRLAVVDATGQAGSVEHHFEAGLSSVGPVELADLLLSPTKAPAGGIRLVADPTIDDEPFGAYLELYPKSPDALTATQVTIEIADSDSAPALASTAAVVAQTHDKGRLIAQAGLPLAMLPPGDYVARAVVVAGGAHATQARAFRLAHAVPAGEAFRADLQEAVGGFQREQVLTPSLLKPALEHARELDDGKAGPEAQHIAAALEAGDLSALSGVVPAGDASLLGAFTRGLTLFQANNLEEAAQQFRLSVRSSPDFLRGIFYLGACYAAGGRMREAVGAWQTTLVGDDSSPEIYQLLVDGTLRLGDTDAAIDLIQEAVAKWPEDYRFVVRGTLAKAAAGDPGGALARLTPWLDAQGHDRVALDLAVRLAVADVAARSAGSEREAVERLMQLAERFTSAGYTLPPLVARWIKYLKT
jgi:VWFA-related protein